MKKKKKVYNNICVYCENKVSYTKGTKPKVCPYCNKKNYIKPPLETDLFILQNKYIKTQNKVVLGEIFLLLQKYAVGKIKKILKNKGSYSVDYIFEKASDSASSFIEYYLTKPNFIILHSFGGYLEWQIKSALFNKKDRLNDNLMCLHTLMKDDKEVLELDNFSPAFNQDNCMDVDFLYSLYQKEDIKRGIINIIDASITELIYRTSYSNGLLTLFAVRNYIENRELKNRSYFDFFGRSMISENVDYIMTLIMNFLKRSDEWKL